MAQTETLGWIGTGVMGEPMCGHLLDAGHNVYVYSRSRDKTENLQKKGATWCHSPADIARQCRIIFTMVGSPDEVEQVYFGDDGLFAALQAQSVLVDMGTTPPSLALNIAARAGEAQSHAVDAPVTGGDVGARNGTLSIMVGGDQTVVQSLQPLFDCMAKQVTWMGPEGHGQHTKLCNQVSCAGSMIGMCEALVYAEQAGLDTRQMIAAIQPGAAGSWVLDNLAPRIVDGDFAPGFMVEHFIKDLGIAVGEAGNLGLDLPGLQLAYRLYQQTQQLGHGRDGTQALVLALQQLAANEPA